jgi:hypothetical protein
MVGHKASTRIVAFIAKVNGYIDGTPASAINFDELARNFPDVRNENLKRSLLRYQMYFKFDRATKLVTKAPLRMVPGYY